MPVFTPPSDPMLSRATEEVPIEAIASAEIQNNIERMLKVAQGERTNSGNTTLVGLAAPQIGIPKRIILVDTNANIERSNLGTLTVFINPKIVWASKDQVVGRESCYSVDFRVAGLVPRAHSIKIEAFDRQGNPISGEFTDFTARIFQHEIDHLEGIRFPDRIGCDGVLQWVEESEFPEYRKNWENWPARCPWATWQAMKTGQDF